VLASRTGTRAAQRRGGRAAEAERPKEMKGRRGGGARTRRRSGGSSGRRRLRTGAEEAAALVFLDGEVMPDPVENSWIGSDIPLSWASKWRGDLARGRFPRGFAAQGKSRVPSGILGSQTSLYWTSLDAVLKSCHFILRVIVISNELICCLHIYRRVSFSYMYGFI